MTLQEAKQLKPGDYVHHVTVKNADGTPARCRITGMVQTWKRDPSRVRVPFKRGMYEYGAVEAHNLGDFELGYGS